MNEDKLNNQIPILRFLNKHKWRIILPLLFALFYFALPRYLTQYIAVQQNVFFKSSILSKAEMSKEFLNIREQVLSDESLKNLIFKYDLYKAEREDNVAENLLIEKLRNSVEIRLDDEAANQSFTIWIHFRKENAQNIAALSNEVMSRFEKNPNIHIDKYVTEPYDTGRYRDWVFVADIMLQGLFFLSVPLILIWEIPNIFYSPKTKEMVFEPLMSDWQSELNDAKLNNRAWDALRINICYSYAFLGTILQKSPIGDFTEFIRKFAK